MDKKRQRSYSDEEEDKENRMEKRLKRLENAILKRENKRHKKRRRRHRGLRSSSSETDRRQRSRGRSRERSQLNSPKGSSVDDESIQREISGSSQIEMGQEIATQSASPEQLVDQTVAQAGILTSSLAAGQVVHETAAQSGLTQNFPAMGQLAQQTVVITQSGAPQRANAVGQSHGVPGEGSQSIQPANCEVPLDPEILEILGRRFAEDRVLAAAIPTELVIRWEEILKRGLPTEERVSLIKKYPPPSNCIIIDPPRVNPEVQASLHESVAERDERIYGKQTKMTACLAAIGKSFRKVLEGGGEKLLILEQLSDASRLLADLLHDESIIRKSLILANLNVSCKETLNATIPDEWLFGKQLEEKLKAAKALESSRKELKAPQKLQVYKNSKNLTVPPRRRQNNQKSATMSGGRKELRNQGYSSYRRDNHKNGNNWRNNQKSERSNNRKRY
ncbi:uncharacterized protein [Venturia canescens]|uniref:uncharacterized protein isoform X2 n=1 Tax=Venturia canescens TaxID=32260 RepID=UPI001C9C3D9D|nr:uncharacterized protein LOC122408440 isoform X2 [Venturia canescens]XP_043271182.1 uncharacterized protein LOC122408440 isoform X2 [Venturia canescens]XP_043271184.1 uncharacterized protein LOC122408440 isoform X2 [Venturia canescens]